MLRIINDIMAEAQNAQAIDDFIGFEWDALSPDGMSNKFHLYFDTDNKKIFYDEKGEGQGAICICEPFDWMSDPRFSDPSFDELQREIKDKVYINISNILFSEDDDA